MKPLQLLIAFFFVTVSNKAISQDLVPPSLEFVCELKVTIDPAMRIGSTAHGDRIIIPITGGTFEGPKMKGTVLLGGADYQYSARGKGRTEIEAIYTVKTDDGIFIHIRNAGLIYSVPRPNNESSNINQFYFRAAPKFEAPSDSKYDWLNNALFICRGVPQQGYVSIQVWKVQ